MLRRPGPLGVLVLAAGVLLALRYVAGVPWGARAAVALLLGYAVFRIGTGSLLPLHVRDRRGAPVDVDAEDGLPVYSCGTCGTQLVLLRQGTDKPPRHCGEPMTLSVVTEDDGAGLL